MGVNDIWMGNENDTISVGLQKISGPLGGAIDIFTKMEFIA